MSYANWDDLIIRYKELNKLGGNDEVNSAFIHPAERALDSKLAPYYTTPFSSNNYTATDLTLELVYARYYQTINPKKAEIKMKAISARIKALQEGTEYMVTTSGALVRPSASEAGVAYSNTMSYHPTFGIGDVETFHPSSAQLYDEENTRDY